jgi:hypothetical protein
MGSTDSVLIPMKCTSCQHARLRGKCPHCIDCLGLRVIGPRCSNCHTRNEAERKKNYRDAKTAPLVLDAEEVAANDSEIAVPTVPLVPDAEEAAPIVQAISVQMAVPVPIALVPIEGDWQQCGPITEQHSPPELGLDHLLDADEVAANGSEIAVPTVPLVPDAEEAAPNAEEAAPIVQAISVQMAVPVPIALVPIEGDWQQCGPITEQHSPPELGLDHLSLKASSELCVYVNRWQREEANKATKARLQTLQALADSLQSERPRTRAAQASSCVRLGYNPIECMY